MRQLVRCYWVQSWGQIKQEAIVNVLVIGSAPDAVKARDWDMNRFWSSDCNQQCWRAVTHWNELIFPYDFRRKQTCSTSLPSKICDWRPICSCAKSIWWLCICRCHNDIHSWILSPRIIYPLDCVFWVATCITVETRLNPLLAERTARPCEMILHLLSKGLFTQDVILAKMRGCDIVSLLLGKPTCTYRRLVLTNF